MPKYAAAIVPDPVRTFHTLRKLSRDEQVEQANVEDYQRTRQERAQIEAIVRQMRDPTSQDEFIREVLPQIARINPLTAQELKRSFDQAYGPPPTEPLEQIDVGGQPIFTPRSKAVGKPAYRPPLAPVRDP